MKKLIVMFLLLISVVSSIVPSFAFEIDEVNLYKVYDCGNLLKYQGITRRISYVVYKKDGVEYPAYCLNAYLP